MSKYFTGLMRFLAAAIVYASFAMYLYQPYFERFNRWQWLLPVNVCLASLGCFVLSRRWVAATLGSIFAGAIYGFGPFMLSLAKFHPTAGLLAASLPWLFLPAALIGKNGQRWLSLLLSALPFVAVIVFFQLSANYYYFFAIPMRARLNSTDLAALLAPLVMVKRSIILISFYHVPIAALTMGICMLFAARRIGILVILCAGIILAAYEPFLDVSPLIWLAVPMLCCSVLIGAGMQGLVSAGFADRKWILLATIVTGVLAIMTLLLATKYFQFFLGLAAGYARLFTQAGRIYVVGGLVLLIFFFMARAKVRLHWLRWSILCLAITMDVFLGARFIVDRIM